MQDVHISVVSLEQVRHVEFEQAKHSLLSKAPEIQLHVPSE